MSGLAVENGYLSTGVDVLRNREEGQHVEQL